MLCICIRRRDSVVLNESRRAGTTCGALLTREAQGKPLLKVEKPNDHRLALPQTAGRAFLTKKVLADCRTRRGRAYRELVKSGTHVNN